MSTLEPWIAGFFDSSGFVYRTVKDKLAVRIMLPHANLADQIQARLGGRVKRGRNNLEGAQYISSKPRDIDEFLWVIGPWIRGQQPARDILEFWRYEDTSIDEAQCKLEAYYKRYIPNIRPLRSQTQSPILESPQDSQGEIQ